MQPELLERATWSWGLSLIVLTVAIHTTGVVMMMLTGLHIRLRLQKLELDSSRTIPIVIGLIGAAALILAALHGLEATLWATAYVRLGAFGSLTEALLLSVGAMTTAGAAGLVLPFRWQMLGALEAVNGMLLFGISTAFLFSVIQVYWPILSRRA